MTTVLKPERDSQLFEPPWELQEDHDTGEAQDDPFYVEVMGINPNEEYLRETPVPEPLHECPVPGSFTLHRDGVAYLVEWDCVICQSDTGDHS